MPLDTTNIRPNIGPDIRPNIGPNIVPDNNLRLPDAVTITHGPRPLLARFILEGDKAARRIGLHLRVRHDFDEMLFLNRAEAARGNWYPIVDMFNPERVDLNPENAFWISGENPSGEIVVTWGARIYDWRGTNLAEQACAMFYGEDRGQLCEITAEAAARISGIVVCGVASWVHPDYRRQHLSRLIPRVGKAYACGRWPIDWSFCYVTRKHVEQGLAASYGQKNVSSSVSYPGTPWLDIAVAYSTANEVYDDMRSFLASDLSEGSSPQSIITFEAPVGSTSFEHIVTNTSSDGVFQGNRSLS
jgi:hypothetical protein